MGRSKRRLQPEHIEIGAQVRHEREAANVSREELAAALDISVSVLGRIETGEVALTAARAGQIAKALGIRVARIYGETPLAS